MFRCLCTSRSNEWDGWEEKEKYMQIRNNNESLAAAAAAAIAAVARAMPKYHVFLLFSFRVWVRAVCDVRVLSASSFMTTWKETNPRIAVALSALVIILEFFFLLESLRQYVIHAFFRLSLLRYIRFISLLVLSVIDSLLRIRSSTAIMVKRSFEFTCKKNKIFIFLAACFGTNLESFICYQMSLNPASSRLDSIWVFRYSQMKL